MAEMTDVARVVVRYGGGLPEIVDAVLMRAPDPRSGALEPTGRRGAWLTVRDPAGQEVFRRVLPDPATANEVGLEDSRIGRLEGPAERLVLVELPWPGEGSTLEVHVGAGGAVVLEAAPILMQLKPRSLIRLEGVGPPSQVFPIWGHDNPKALTLLFLADGFRAEEMDRFHEVVDRCVDLFDRTAPFSGMKPALRAMRVDTASNDSGVAGEAPRDTAFRGRFQSGSLGRVILVDQGRALDALNTHVSGSGVALVVANTEVYGGSGGAALAFSCEASAPEIAMHELGHSAFGLADEYEDDGQSATDEPVEPNVSASGERPGLKWAQIVPPGVPLPTLRAGEAPPHPPPSGVGAFEGAKYHERGIFRPAFDCRMRTLGSPFCPVCQQVIGRVLARHSAG
jgi:hypothetical protein